MAVFHFAHTPTLENVPDTLFSYDASFGPDLPNRAAIRFRDLFVREAPYPLFCIFGKRFLHSMSPLIVVINSRVEIVN